MKRVLALQKMKVTQPPTIGLLSISSCLWKSCISYNNG